MLLISYALAIGSCSCFGEAPIQKQMKQQAAEIQKLMANGYVRYVEKQSIAINNVARKTQSVFNAAVNNGENLNECCFIQQASRLGLLQAMNGNVVLLNRIAPYSTQWVRLLQGHVTFDRHNLPGVTKEASIDILSEQFNKDINTVPHYVSKFLSWLPNPTDKAYFCKLLLTTNFIASDVVVSNYLTLLQNDEDLTHLLELQLKYMLIYNVVDVNKFNTIKEYHSTSSWKYYNQLDLIKKAQPRPSEQNQEDIQAVYDYVFESIEQQQGNLDVVKAFVLSTSFTNQNCKSFAATFEAAKYKLSNTVYIRSLYNALVEFDGLQCTDDIENAITAEKIKLRFFKTLASELLSKVPQSEQWLAKTSSDYFTQVEGIKYSELVEAEQALLLVVKNKAIKQELRVLGAKMYFYGAARQFAIHDEGYLEIVKAHQPQLDGYIEELDATLTIDEVLSNILQMTKGLDGPFQQKQTRK